MFSKCFGLIHSIVKTIVKNSSGRIQIEHKQQWQRQRLLQHQPQSSCSSFISTQCFILIFAYLFELFPDKSICPEVLSVWSFSSNNIAKHICSAIHEWPGFHQAPLCLFLCLYWHQTSFQTSLITIWLLYCLWQCHMAHISPVNYPITFGTFARKTFATYHYVYSVLKIPLVFSFHISLWQHFILLLASWYLRMLSLLLNFAL